MINEFLGIDITVLIKALHNGFYARYNDEVSFVAPEDILNIDLVTKAIYFGGTYVDFGTYGIDWDLER